MIHEFFAVTETSVYHVKDDDGSGKPSATKVALALKGKSKLSVGYILRGAKIIIYNFLDIESPEDGHGGHTSPIVALLKDKEEALRCLESENLKSCGSRWMKQTREVLDEIGDNHPAFEINRTPGFSLIPDA